MHFFTAVILLLNISVFLRWAFGRVDILLILSQFLIQAIGASLGLKRF
jgi:hypothetical protein